jgi:hypothetical protein
VKIILQCLALALLVTACASPQVNWSGRVGSYTYDQAVQELGRPQTVQPAPGGGHIAEWLTERGTPRRIGYGLGGGYANPDLGIGEPRVVEDYPATPDKFLHLEFGADGKLAAWKWINRDVKD